MNKIAYKIQKAKTICALRKMYKKSGWESLNLLDECLAQVKYELRFKYNKQSVKDTNND